MTVAAAAAAVAAAAAPAAAPAAAAAAVAAAAAAVAAAPAAVACTYIVSCESDLRELLISVRLKPNFFRANRNGLLVRNRICVDMIAVGCYLFVCSADSFSRYEVFGPKKSDFNPTSILLLYLGPRRDAPGALRSAAASITRASAH